ncbi:MAG TPA: ATP synthase F0 subunit B [Blastocatellia bacterium]|nr:ATP synthase F0 subunit B [Blastocatellia bacterium]
MKQSLLSLALFIPGQIDFQPTVLLIHPAIPKAVNLAVFLGVLYYFLRKPTREFFRQRFATIRASLEHAAKEKEVASAKLAEISARLDRLDSEIAAIRSQAEQEAVAERQRIEALARQDAEKLRQTARREIESARNTALAELQEFTAAKSVEMAERIIRQELTADDDSRLLNRMSQEIQKASQAKG